MNRYQAEKVTEAIKEFVRAVIVFDESDSVSEELGERYRELVSALCVDEPDESDLREIATK